MIKPIKIQFSHVRGEETYVLESMTGLVKLSVRDSIYRVGERVSEKHVQDLIDGWNNYDIKIVNGK